MQIPDVTPVFIQPLKDFMVLEGSKVRLECKVTGRPAPTVEWFKDGISIRVCMNV